MDPIQPIAPDSLGTLARMGRSPVEPPERVSRERDRPAQDGGERKRRNSPATPPPPSRDPDDGLPHIDVRA
jgi:hypothetical protein